MRVSSSCAGEPGVHRGNQHKGDSSNKVEDEDLRL